MMQVEEIVQVVQEMAGVSEETIKTKGRKVPGAATYKSSFNNEWTSKWHIESKGHQAKQQALKSTSTINNFSLPLTAEMSAQEVKISGFDTEDLVVDIEYWFKGSTNREKLNVGFTTTSTLNRLLEAGEVTLHKAQQFQQAALAFLVGAVEYAMDKPPLKDPLLKHARFIDVQLRAECGVEDALYFVDSKEFMEYQLMDIALPQDSTVFDVEEFCGRMSST
ncbi:uncharacterized protein LOC115396888 isoform X4 [Tachysurus ichikawai]